MRAAVLLVPLMSLAVLLASNSSMAGEKKEEKQENQWKVSEPQGEVRSVSIDTDETTWSNLDISPDGKTIIFDMLGDIYTMPITGGEANCW